MKALYNIFLFFYPIGARLLSFKNAKARKWIDGRKGLFDQLSNTITSDRPLIWVHCASLGEFEQARPLIEGLRSRFPNYRIMLTFFSPSGYEVRKDYPGADYVFYLPLDSAAHAARFIDVTNPAMAIFVKYEFWYYYIMEAKRRNIPLVLASGVFRQRQPFFQWYGDFHREMLRGFSRLFVQDQQSVDLLASIGITKAIQTGDTRFDRVLAIAGDSRPVDYIDSFCGSHPVVVAGSTWSEDDKELDHFANTNQHVRFIIAPHDVSAARIAECLSLYKNAILLSQLRDSGNGQPSTNNTQRANVLIIDNIGLLSRLYRYATIAYVGGGFGGDGVHNVLEAAVYGKPVVFGPVFDKYVEAVKLEECGGGFSVGNALELEKQFHQLLDDEFLYKRACLASADFVRNNAGATEKILDYFQEKRLLTT
ncbi:MAG: lipid 3-deoxy-D-manno-octulosonic acid transferase [Chitinophagaceae bacterium]|nr:lipid 3-deoxy-D-manno-octulosonic acid transferase [Chitinophagaceae bacterium]